MPLDFSATVTVDLASWRLPIAARHIYYVEPELLRAALAFSGGIIARGPRETGRMVAAASHIEAGGTSVVEQWIGVGPFRLLGEPSDIAPQGQISAFIAANPRLRGSRPPTARGAWWTLSRHGQAKLRGERMLGMWGMAGGLPRYWQAIHEHEVPTKTGGRIGSNFIDQAHNDAENPYIRNAHYYLAG